MKKNNAFTLAEILITLVIIGVVAALTIPTLMNSTGDKEYVAASKRVLATVAEAGRQMAVEDDIKRYKNVVDFVENGLSKRVDINKYCAPIGSGSTKTTGVPTDCGFAKNYTTQDGESTTIDFSTNITKTAIGASSCWGMTSPCNYNNIPTTGDSIKGYSFQMSNGYSVLLFYNQKCLERENYWITAEGSGSTTDHTTSKYICIAGVYDMNGKKGPNQAGRDLGFFAVEGAGITSVSSVALPLTVKSNSAYSWMNAIKFCENQNSMLPSVEELSAISMAYKLVTSGGNAYWASSHASGSQAWDVGFNYYNGWRAKISSNYSRSVVCIKK